MACLPSSHFPPFPLPSIHTGRRLAMVVVLFTVAARTCRGFLVPTPGGQRAGVLGRAAGASLIRYVYAGEEDDVNLPIVFIAYHNIIPIVFVVNWIKDAHSPPPSLPPSPTPPPQQQAPTTQQPLPSPPPPPPHVRLLLLHRRVASGPSPSNVHRLLLRKARSHLRAFLPRRPPLRPYPPLRQCGDESI